LFVAVLLLLASSCALRKDFWEIELEILRIFGLAFRFRNILFRTSFVLCTLHRSRKYNNVFGLQLLSAKDCYALNLSPTRFFEIDLPEPVLFQRDSGTQLFLFKPIEGAAESSSNYNATFHNLDSRRSIVPIQRRSRSSTDDDPTLLRTSLRVQADA
jgi:hypothetical protein